MENYFVFVILKTAFRRITKPYNKKVIVIILVTGVHNGHFDITKTIENLFGPKCYCVFDDIGNYLGQSSISSECPLL